MAPEQFHDAKSVGFTADIYAIGIVIYRTLTGRLPFVSRSLDAVIRMKSEQVVPRISTMPGMPKNPLLDWFVEKATARAATARFKSAREMLEQWWSVMPSLDDLDATTDVMQGVGRVDESYAGPLRRAMSDSPGPASDEARTIRRPPRSRPRDPASDPAVPTV